MLFISSSGNTFEHHPMISFFFLKKRAQSAAAAPHPSRVCVSASFFCLGVRQLRVDLFAMIEKETFAVILEKDIDLFHFPALNDFG